MWSMCGSWHWTCDACLELFQRGRHHHVASCRGGPTSTQTLQSLTCVTAYRDYLKTRPCMRHDLKSHSHHAPDATRRDESQFGRVGGSHCMDDVRAYRCARSHNLTGLRLKYVINICLHVLICMTRTTWPCGMIETYSECRSTFKVRSLSTEVGFCHCKMYFLPRQWKQTFKNSDDNLRHSVFFYIISKVLWTTL